MKNIIEEQTMTEIRSLATEKWHEYVAAEKLYGKPEYTDLKKVYNQIRKGHKIIDIFKVIQKAGTHENLHPKLAIAKANVKKITCFYSENGRVLYVNDRDRRNNDDVVLPLCLPKFDRTQVFKPTISDGRKYWWTAEFTLQAPVPIIPAKFMPKQLTDDYYILWEVDEWEMVPPTDPYLLKRITKTLFVVLAAWDLTPLEKSVMAGRMY